jgi:predicted transposase/invertase (TIGR01784 family)
MAFSTKKVIKTCNCNRLLDTQSKVVQAKREGMQKGRQEVARNLKKLGIPVEQIAQGTGLSPDEIAAL